MEKTTPLFFNLQAAQLKSTVVFDRGVKFVGVGPSCWRVVEDVQKKGLSKAKDYAKSRERRA